MSNIYFYLSKFLAPFLNLTNLFFTTVLLFALIYFKSKSRIIFSLFKINIIVLISIVFFPLGKLGLKYLENDYINQVPLKNIENIIVLAGSEDISSTIKTNKLNLNEGSERLITSISLANKHISSKIYFVGGNGYIVNDNLSELDVAKKFYSELKFDLNRIIYIGGTRNTIENLIEIKKLNFDPSTSILVTSAFHMKRSMMISEKIGLKLMPYAVDFRSISNKSFLNIYQRYSISANLSDFDLFIREIIGILAFKILI